MGIGHTEQYMGGKPEARASLWEVLGQHGRLVSIDTQWEKCAPMG